MNPDKKNDERFVALLVTNQQRIFRYLMTLVPIRADAQDLLQQTFLTMWQNRLKYNPELGEFASWGCTIALNHVRNFRRREKTRRTMLSEETIRSLISTQADHSVSMEEWQQSLELCMSRLTPHQQKVISESYGGKNLKSAGLASGKTPNAIYKILRHIRGKLRDCIEKTIAEGGVA